MPHSIFALFLIIGLMGGLVGGLLGVGGGILFVPCLHYGFQAMGVDTDISMKISVATSLAVILITALSAALGHTLNGIMDPRSVLIMAVMAFPSAFVGSKIGDLIGGAFLERAFGVVSLLVAVKFLMPIPSSHQKGDRVLEPTHLVMVGGISGLLSSILGVGGGIITVPLLHLALDVPMNRAVANSSGLIVFSAVAGTMGWILSGWGAEGLPAFSLGYVNMAAWVLIASAAMIAAQVGVWLADRLDPNRLRYPFGFLLIMVGVKMAIF